MDFPFVSGMMKNVKRIPTTLAIENIQNVHAVP
jgi:hypothetical protein